MCRQTRVRQQQMLRECEGYLELSLACADQLDLPREAREKLALRAQAVLERLPAPETAQSQIAYLAGQAFRVRELYPEAIEQLRAAADFDPDNVHIWLALGWCYKRSGRLDLAIEALESAMDADGSRGIIYYNLACYWSLAHNAKLSLAYLSRALELDASYREMIEREPDFDPIRTDPRFQQLVEVIV